MKSTPIALLAAIVNIIYTSLLSPNSESRSENKNTNVVGDKNYTA